MDGQDLQIVKKEVEDTTIVSKKTMLSVNGLLPEQHAQEEENCQRSAGQNEQQHVALALLCQTQSQEYPPARRPRISFSLGKPKKETEEKLPMITKKKKRSSGCKAKHVASDPGAKRSRCKQNNTATDKFISAGEFKSPALVRAEEVQSNLEPAFPSFVKSMVRSHVGSCFWMGLPGLFCRANLPSKDCTVTLEDESGNQFDMKYLAYKTGLSAGWRQFCVAHHLQEGDVLVFHLVEPYKFKVYVIRADDLTEVDGALGLLNLDAPKLRHTGKLVQSDMTMGSCKYSGRKHQRPLTLASVQKKKKKNGMPGSAPNIRQTAEQSENDSEEVRSEVLEGYKLSRPSPMFTDIESLADFRILVDGFSIDSDISEDIRIKYYKLCCSQNSFLHENCIMGISSKLIIGAITEVVSISDAMRACKLTTTQDKYASWDKTLKALELLGMHVGFLRARIRQLFRFAYESEDAVDARKYVEAKAKLERTGEEIKNLEARLVELREASLRFGDDIESLETRAESYELKFQEEVLAFW